MPAGKPSAGAPLGETERQIDELGVDGVHRLETTAEARQVAEAGRRIVLEGQHHLEQRIEGERARRVEHLDQPLERQVLMAIGSEIGRPHPRDQVAEARIAGRVGAQHESIDEEADQIVERAVGAAGDRAADRDVGAGPQPRQQGRERGLQHHEQARPPLARQRQQAAMQLRRQRKRHAVAAIARHRRARPIARQIDLIGKTLESVGPERQLARNRALRVALLAQHLVLP